MRKEKNIFRSVSIEECYDVFYMFIDCVFCKY